MFFIILFNLITPKISINKIFIGKNGAYQGFNKHHKRVCTIT